MKKLIKSIAKDHQNDSEMIAMLDKILALLDQQKQNTSLSAKDIADLFGVNKEPEKIEKIDFVLSLLEKSELIEGLKATPIYKSFYILPYGREFVRTSSFNKIRTSIFYNEIVTQTQKDSEEELREDQKSIIKSKSKHMDIRLILLLLALIASLYKIYLSS